MFEIEKLSLGVLIPYENNPRINEKAVQAVANSIKEFGFNVPIIIDKNNVIVAGHTRYEACKLLGMGSVPCHRVENLTDEQVRAYRLADNKTAELADWDFSKLEEELAALELDMGDFGFELEEEKDEEPSVSTDTNYNYSEQYGVIVICESESEQEEVFNNLTSQGYACKVVAV